MAFAKKATKAAQKEPSISEMADAIRNLAVAMQEIQAQIDSMMGDAFRSGNGHEQSSIEAEQAYEPSDEEKANLKLVNLVFDTPPEKLPELTETPRIQITPTSMVEAQNEFLKAAIMGKRVLLSDIFILRRDKRMRSVGRKSLMEAMAFAQVQKEEEEADKMEL